MADQKDFVVRSGIVVPNNSTFGANVAVTNRVTTNALVTTSAVANTVAANSATSNTLTVLVSANVAIANVGTVNANIANIVVLSSNAATINVLTFTTGSGAVLGANILTANTGTIATLGATTLTVATGTANTLGANTFTSNTATVANVNSNNVVANTASIRTLGANSVTMNTLTVGDLTVTGNSSLTIPQGQVFRGYREYVDVRTGVSGSTNMDLLNSNIFNFTLSANTTLAVSNVPASGISTAFTLLVKQPAGGNARLTWPSGTVWSEGVVPVQSLGANQVDVFTFFTVDGGVMWIGAHSFANVS